MNLDDYQIMLVQDFFNHVLEDADTPIAWQREVMYHLTFILKSEGINPLVFERIKELVPKDRKKKKIQLNIKFE